MYHRIIKLLTSAILLVLITLKAPAQVPVLQAQFFGIEDGLSHRNVSSIYQDTQGFMWFGTKYGLNRFDGYSFTWFTKEKNGLQSNEIDHILGDNSGRMWLFQTGTFLIRAVKTIDLFDPLTHEVQSFSNAFGEEAPFHESEVISFGNNQKGGLVFLTKSLLATYDGKFETKSINIPDVQTVERIYWAPDGRFWLTTKSNGRRTTLLILDDQGNIQHEFYHESSIYLNIYELDEHGGGKYTNLNNGVFQLGTPLECYQVSPNGTQSKDQSAEQFFSKNEIFKVNTGSIFQKIQSDYWVSTFAPKFFILSKSGGEPFRLSDEYEQTLNSTSIYSDRDGAVWVGTQFGVYRFMLKPPLFQRLLYNKKEKSSGKPFAIRGLQVSPAPSQARRGNLWGMVENRGGLWKVNLDSGQESDPVYQGDTRYALGKNRNGDILVPIGDKLNFLNPNDGELISQSAPIKRPNEPFSTWIIHEDKYGKIWLDNQGGLDIRYLQNGKLTVLEDWMKDDGLNFVYQIYENETDTALVATSSGIFTLDIRKGQMLQRYWKGGEGEYYLPFDNVHHIHEDNNGTFWLATAGNGLVHWNRYRGMIKQFTRADGLPDNTLYAVYPDKHNNLWLSTDYGIAAFNKSTKHVRGYTEKDGLTHNEFNRISHCQDEMGNIYFGSLNGVTAFHPDDFFGDTASFRRPLVITKFQQFNGKTNKLVDRTVALRQSQTITMKPGDNLFTLEFSLLVYDEMDNVQYGYQVEGVDSDWIYQKENTIRLSRLPYGEHTLRIKGQASNGQWSKVELMLKVEVLKPFYLQLWFIIAAISALTGGIYLYNKQRINNLKSRQDELERMVKERTSTIEAQKEELQSLERLKSRFFANVSHELRTPLTLMLGPISSVLNRNRLENRDFTLLLKARDSG